MDMGDKHPAVLAVPPGQTGILEAVHWSDWVVSDEDNYAVDTLMDMFYTKGTAS